MGKADRISGVFWLCFSILMIIQSYRLGLGKINHPGPGFLFFWVNIILAIMSLVVLVKGWTGKKGEGAQPGVFEGQKLSKIAYVLIALFIYVLLMETVGFIPMSLLFFMFVLGIIEKKKWLFTIFVSILVTVISYLIFQVWLQCMLPYGLCDFLGF